LAGLVRDPGTIGMEGRVGLADAGIDGVASRVQAWREAGAPPGYERVAGLGVDTGAAPSGFPPGPDW
jgi:hypothetical protein